MVTRTHRLKVLRTPQRHTWAKPATGLGRRIAALLIIDRFASAVCVLIDSVLHVACAIELLRQRIEYGLCGRRWLGSLPGRATHDEQNRQRYRQNLRVAHMYLGTASRSRGRVYNRRGLAVTRSSRMFRYILLMLVSAGLYAANLRAAESTVDIETAAKIYQDAAVREQVRASLGSMPEHIRQLFSAD